MTQKTRSAEVRRCTEAMRALTNAVRARFEEEWRETGVTLPQLRLLKAVDEVKEQQPAGSAASIARLCQVTPQTLHSMLGKAAREGWIVRGSSEENHRFVTASLTPAGQALLARGLAYRDRIEAELWRGISVAALTGLRITLETALANLEPAAPAGHPHPTA